MLADRMRMAAAWLAANPRLYVEDVFSTYLYTGNGSTQTITNGIDLAGKGGVVWQKSRSLANAHFLTDTVRGTTAVLQSHATSASATITDNITSFNSNGFSIGANGSVNTNLSTNVSWTFRKAPKFFDIVTYAGDNVGGRVISSNLESVGMVMIKRTNDTGNWMVLHRSVTSGYYLYLNTADMANPGAGVTLGATSITFASDSSFNGIGDVYVAYFFAHDTDTTNGMIQCGSFTGTGATGNNITLGWEPQYLMVKKTSAASQWFVYDVMRGWQNIAVMEDKYLWANSSIAEGDAEAGSPTATGFNATTNINDSAATYIYLAIRRPNKPPLLGTQVFNALVDSSGASPKTFSVGFPADFVMHQMRTGATSYCGTRLTGGTQYLVSSSTAAEANGGAGTWSFDKQDSLTDNLATLNNVLYAFRRAPGVFDIVCYTGTGAGQNVAHNLAAIPELKIIKCRSNATTNWEVQHSALSRSDLYLESTAASPASITTFWSANPDTVSLFYTRDSGNDNVNLSARTYVAYLFATKAGVSKVGSYTGNGSTQTLDMGFSGGARFFMVKRTDSTGDWFVFDNTRGIVAADDPHLSLNTTAAEVTNDDSVDPEASGIKVNELAATHINVTSATYIYLAFA